jgi:multidrug efflux system membrane fusion protein
MPLQLPRFALPLLVSALLLAACSKPAPTEEPVRAVKLMTVGEGSIQTSLEFSADVRARVESRLGFRVGGKVVRRVVEPGQTVKAGQMLAQLDPQDYKLATDAARAQVAAAQTHRGLAAADFKRYKELRDQNFISGAELERRDTTLKAAQAQLEQAQAQLNSQGNQAGYTTLVADVSGVVTAVSAEVGQVVAAGTPVVQIAQDGPRDVVFAVPEDKVAQITQGSKVEVRVWASKTQLTGTVREVAASADPVTRTFTVKVALGAKDALPLGTTVSVTPKALERRGEPVIKLPTSALLKAGEGSSVWVLDAATMTVKSQPVVVATADGNDAVISSGLAPGMQVVVAGVHVLSPGQRVSVYKEKIAAAPAQPAPAAMDSVAPASAVSAVAK